MLPFTATGSPFSPAWNAPPSTVTVSVTVSLPSPTVISHVPFRSVSDALFDTVRRPVIVAGSRVRVIPGIR
jgi:hypothetical protein